MRDAQHRSAERSRWPRTERRRPGGSGRAGGSSISMLISAPAPPPDRAAPPAARAARRRRCRCQREGERGDRPPRAAGSPGRPGRSPDQDAHGQPAGRQPEQAAGRREHRRLGEEHASASGRRSTPRPCSRPTSRVRSETETSITFMMPMPATVSEIAAMPAERQGQGAEDLREGGQHRVLGEHRDVLLAVVALVEQRDRACCLRPVESRSWRATSTMMRKSDRAVEHPHGRATGTCTTSSRSMPSGRRGAPSRR